MRKMRILGVLVLGLLIFSCVKNKNLQNTQTEVQLPDNFDQTMVARHIVTVDEVIQGTSYTYMRVSENGKENWIAVNKQEANKGDVYYYEKALQMDNFTSKELNKTFDVIYFVSQLSTDPNMISDKRTAMTAHSGKVQSEKKDVSVEKSQGEITIGELYKNRTKYAGQKIKISGAVVKVNKGVMGKNWIHVQDGTSDNGNFDLTITSQDDADVDDKVTFEGTITLNKNFGSGYFYDVIMEDASLLSSDSGSKSIL